MNNMTWILSTERLPEESGSYLVTDSFGDVLFLNYSKKYNLWNANDRDTEEEAKQTGWGADGYTVAWMPLPAPYVKKD